MDGSFSLLESLDSLWFFTNIMISSKPDQPLTTKEEKESPKPMSPVVHAQIHEPPCTEFETPECGDFETEVQVEVPTKTEESMKRSRRKRRKILRMLDLDLGYKDYGFWVEEKCGYGMFGSQEIIQLKMPPLSDGIAMKKHLKSWAYAVAVAVACSVR